MAARLLTHRRLRYWFNRINRECFDGLLPDVTLTFGRSPFPDVCGLFWGGDQQWRLHIDSRCVSRADFVGAVAHEMVHLWQAANDLPLDHGALFQAEADRLAARYGVPV